MLGKAPYPKLEQVLDVASQATGGDAHVHYIAPENLPLYEGAPIPDNVFTLAVAINRTRLGELIPPADAEQVLRTRWKRGVERNLFAFKAGLEFGEPATRRIYTP
jgi:hypothetical protein